MSGVHFSVTNRFLPHQKPFSDISLTKKRVRKKKETLGLLNHRRDKYRKQQNHHSIFVLHSNMNERKGGKWIIQQSRSDGFFFFFFDKIERGKRNSIAEPYAMHKRCLYGPSFNSIFFLFFFSPYFNPIFQDRRTVHA